MDAATPAAAEPPPLTHREAQRIVWGILLPVFMGSLELDYSRERPADHRP